MAPRLIRGRPLAERIRAYLNPFEVLLRLSEELDTGDWDHQYKEWANSTGFLLNLIFLIARANSGYDTGRRTDDVFGDDGGYTNWFGWLVRAAKFLCTVSLFADEALSRQLLSSISSLYYQSPTLRILCTVNGVIDFSKAH